MIQGDAYLKGVEQGGGAGAGTGQGRWRRTIKQVK